jgi:acetone carboxylase gamma subunit
VFDPVTVVVDIAATEKLRSQSRAERVRRYARPGRKLSGRVLLNATQTLDIREVAGAEPHHVCAQCATDLGGLSENYKERCIREDHPISSANPLIGEPARFIDDQPVFRQFFCIGCGVLIENEVTLTPEPVLRDLAFDLHPAMRTPR